MDGLNYKTVTLRMNRKEIEDLDQGRALQDMGRSEFIRLAVAFYLEHLDRDNTLNSFLEVLERKITDQIETQFETVNAAIRRTEKINDHIVDIHNKTVTELTRSSNVMSEITQIIYRNRSKKTA